ncbi:MAG: ACP S-malonyltransferase [Thermoguttaceae bacterium]|nr:ACP S-malonyltransferase [Thermoguttaceae bacterium]
MGKTAFLFPGQGAQVVGMGKVLYDTLPEAKALFDQADDILGYSLTDLCFNGPIEQLSTTVISQPALFVTSLAALESLKKTNPEVVEACSCAAGLSLGEYTALACAGSLSFEDGLRLVAERGKAMQAAADATPSGMVSLLSAEIPVVEELCEKAREGEILQIANLLCPGNTVVSGTKAACERVVKLAEETGAARPIALAVAGAFHTPIMRPADERLAEVLAGVQISTPKFPVISNVDAEAHNDPDGIRAILVRQILSPVQWETTIRKLIADGYDSFWEIGPGRVLRGLMKRIDRKIPCQGVEC